MNQHHYTVNMTDLETLVTLRLLYLAKTPEEAINMAKADIALQFPVYEEESAKYAWIAQEVVVNITAAPVWQAPSA